MNPFGGVISDRFSRRKILMTTDWFVDSFVWRFLFITNDSLMIAALIFANIVRGHCLWFFLDLPIKPLLPSSRERRDCDL